MTSVAAEKRSKSKTSEQKVWNTKYGPRRVKQALPTLQEAVFAAKGITDELFGLTRLSLSPFAGNSRRAVAEADARARAACARSPATGSR